MICGDRAESICALPVCQTQTHNMQTDRTRLPINFAKNFGLTQLGSATQISRCAHASTYARLPSLVYLSLRVPISLHTRLKALHQRDFNLKIMSGPLQNIAISIGAMQRAFSFVVSFKLDALSGEVLFDEVFLCFLLQLLAASHSKTPRSSCTCALRTSQCRLSCSECTSTLRSR